MMYGLDPEAISKINSVFQKHTEVEEVILYGSRAKGNFRPNSDIDLTLIGENLTINHLFSIETQLDDLLLPYKMDVSIFSQIDNDDFIEHIERVGSVIYTNTRDPKL